MCLHEIIHPYGTEKKGILKEQIIPPSPQKNDNGFYGL